MIVGRLAYHAVVQLCKTFVNFNVTINTNASPCSSETGGAVSTTNSTYRSILHIEKYMLLLIHFGLFVHACMTARTNH